MSWPMRRKFFSKWLVQNEIIYESMAYYNIPFLKFVSQIDKNCYCIPKIYYFRYLGVFLPILQHHL